MAAGSALADLMDAAVKEIEDCAPPSAPQGKAASQGRVVVETTTTATQSVSIAGEANGLSGMQLYRSKPAAKPTEEKPRDDDDAIDLDFIGVAEEKPAPAPEVDEFEDEEVSHDPFHSPPLAVQAIKFSASARAQRRRAAGSAAALVRRSMLHMHRKRRLNARRRAPCPVV